MVGACQKSMRRVPPLPRPGLPPAAAAAAVGARVGAGAAAAGGVVGCAAAGGDVGAGAGGAAVGAGAAAGPQAAASSNVHADRTYRERLIDVWIPPGSMRRQGRVSRVTPDLRA